MAAVGVSPGRSQRENPRKPGRTSKLPRSTTLIWLPSLVRQQPLERLVAGFESSQKFTRYLPINYAFHTARMDPIREDLLTALADIRAMPTRIPFFSSVEGADLPGGTFGCQLLVAQCPRARSVRAYHRSHRGGRPNVFGSGPPIPASAYLSTHCLDHTGKEGAVFHSLRRHTDEVESMLANLAGLHARGAAEIDWMAVNQSGGNFVPATRVCMAARKILAGVGGLTALSPSP